MNFYGVPSNDEGVHFGQSWFEHNWRTEQFASHGIQSAIDFGQFLDVEFWDDKVWGLRRVGPKGWRLKPRKSGAPKRGTLKGGAQKGGAPKGGGPKISRFFFPPPATIVFLLSLSWGPCVEFWWCLKRRALKCARLEFSGCRVRAPAARSGGAAGRRVVHWRGGPAEGSIGNGVQGSGFRVQFMFLGTKTETEQKKMKMSKNSRIYRKVKRQSKRKKRKRKKT